MNTLILKLREQEKHADRTGRWLHGQCAVRSMAVSLGFIIVFVVRHSTAFFGPDTRIAPLTAILEGGDKDWI